MKSQIDYIVVSKRYEGEGMKFFKTLIVFALIGPFFAEPAFAKTTSVQKSKKQSVRKKNRKKRQKKKRFKKKPAAYWSFPCKAGYLKKGKVYCKVSGLVVHKIKNKKKLKKSKRSVASKRRKRKRKK